jgi:two-component system, chemotaxis family, protein-glutamate methylesterase/glutaminase
MIKKIKNSGNSVHPGTPISLLVVDDSLPFRWVLRGIFDKHPKITLVGEASNGIQGLELLIKLKPDVIIMDMEMPLMDGMTALQHLMIHTPTPTIMFSSLTKEGTTRSFDAIKNGAVDFVCKDRFFQGEIIESLKEATIRKVLNAALLSMKCVEPIFPGDRTGLLSYTTVQKVVFCEECGCREVINITNGMELSEVTCSKCGDRIDLNGVNKYRRNNFISFIGAGEGGYSNLLNIIPNLHAEISGSIIVQIYAKTDHVDAFTEYLDSISNLKVIRIRDGLIIEGGNCYVASSNEYISLRPYSAQYTLRCSENYFPGLSPFNAAMTSIASIFKDHVAGVVLSGNETDGEEGIRVIQKNNGSTYILDTRSCLCKRLAGNIHQKCSPEVIRDENGIVQKIESLHLKAKETILTA